MTVSHVPYSLGSGVTSTLCWGDAYTLNPKPKIAMLCCCKRHRCRANMAHTSQGQNMALTVLHLPSSLASGNTPLGLGFRIWHTQAKAIIQAKTRIWHIQAKARILHIHAKVRTIADSQHMGRDHSELAPPGGLVRDPSRPSRRRHLHRDVQFLSCRHFLS